MRALLDTHAWLWMLVAPERLGPARAFIDDEANDLVLSAVSTWEIVIKFAIGRLPLPEPPATYVPSRIRSTGVTPAPIEHSHALAAGDLPDHHRDPFDRLLVAQARTWGIPIVTGDPRVRAYDVEVIGTG